MVSDYDLLARFYDLEHRDLEDVELYRNFAVRCNGEVLEVGCGTGRVTLALAEEGFTVVGVDNSTAMLALARERAAQLGLTERVRLVQADIRTSGVLDEAAVGRERFALTIWPLNGFVHMLTGQDQLEALRNVYRALLPGGLLIVDLPNPYVTFSPATDGLMAVRRLVHAPDGEVLVLSCAYTDLAAQTQRLCLFYDRLDDEGLVHRTTVEMTLRIVYRREMELLLRMAGFEPDAVYGDYELNDYTTDSETMLFVAYKPDGG